MACLDDNTVAALMGGELSGEAKAEVERHVETCAACRQLVAAVLKSDRPLESRLSSADTAFSPAPPPRPTLATGSQVGRYVLLERIGAGGMGVVYSAYDPVLERKVAVKLVRGEGAPEALEEVRVRLLREGKAIAQLSHPNIVTVFDMGTSQGQLFVAMELVDAGSLKRWLREGARGWRDVLEKFLSAGQGLAAAHRAGLVHRDFKPENVLVGADGRVRVTDFGLASTIGAPTPVPQAASPAPLDPRLTRTGALLGTPAYMAPEQHVGQGADALSDQFSFCLALWEGLYGQRPYTAAVDPAAWTLVEPPADTKVPLWLKRGVQRGLSREPQARYPTMEALLSALAADPERTRRVRLLVTAGVLTAALAIAGSSYWASTRASRLCTGAEAEVAKVWTPGLAASVGVTFSGSGVEGASGTWELARQGLEAWWRGWAAMHTEACRATRIRGEQSDQLLGLRMACLERRRSEAAALLDVFKHADKDVVTRAPEAVDALIPVSQCADAQALQAEVPPPENPKVRAQVDEVRGLLIEGKARFDSGRYADALSRATQAVQNAKGLEYRPALAEALLLQGRLQERMGDLKAAEQTLLDAIAAAEASKQDAVTAQAATTLMLVLGSRQARYAEAHSWGKLAEGAIGRIGGSPSLQAQLLQTRGLVQYAQGQLKDAIDSHRQAVALLEKVEPDSLALAEALNSLGAALRGGRQGKEALEAFDRALAILLKKVGPDSDLVATTQNGMGSAQMLDGHFEEALKLYQQALGTFTRRLGPTHFRTITTVNNVGVVLAEEGQYAAALPYFEQVLKARQLTLAKTDAKTADAHANVGMLLVELGRLDEAMAHFDEARGILQGYPRDHFSQAEALLGIGKVQLARRQGAKAKEPLEQVLALCEKKEGFRFEYTRARAHFLLGRALFEGLHQPKEGLALAGDARAALVGFGAERFRRDVAEIDAWLAAHAAP
jgi:tetratricopeptide (TPR) repeat protein